MWSLCLVAAATRGSSPWLAACLVLTAVVAASLRRSPAAPGVLRLFLYVAAAASALRLLGLVLLGSGSGTTVLLELPSVTVWPGIRLGGPLTAEALRAVGYTTGQLIAILACFGAACELGPPRRLLPYLPGALYEVGTAVVVGLTYAPQVAEHASAVRTARRLRSPQARRGGLHDIVRLAGPVLDASLDRSVALAASMESRGFARGTLMSSRRRRMVAGLSLGGLLAVVVGVFMMLAAGGAAPTTWVLLGAGILAVVASLAAGRGAGRTRYRPDPWALPETLLVAGGLLAVVTAWWAATADPASMSPDTALVVPDPPLLACTGVLVAALAAVLTPAVEAP